MNNAEFEEALDAAERGQERMEEYAKRNFDAEAAALPVLTFDQLMHDYLMQSFKPFMDGVSALELGCFHGHFTGLIASEFPDVCVVEASADCIAEARKVAPMAEFIHSTFEEAELDRKFDAVFLTHVLEHLDDPVAVLNRCRGWLDQDGKLFLAVPNGMAASRQIATNMGLLPHPEAVMPAEREHGHRRTYALDTLELEARRAGLRILQTGGVMFKAMAGYQIDAAMKAGIIDEAYLDGAYQLGKSHPRLCSSVFVVCGRAA